MTSAAELLRRHSSAADLVIAPLPVQVRSMHVCLRSQRKWWRCVACLQRIDQPTDVYMSWLECLSLGLPPVLLMRGNSENVVTQYAD